MVAAEEPKRIGSEAPPAKARMRFEVSAAAVLGTLLPLLEAVRRGPAYWLVDVSTMFEDYFAGVLLLASGWLAVRGRPYAKYCLLAAFAYATGMLSLSIMRQVEATLRGNIEPHNGAVLIIKGALWGISAVALFRAFQHVRASSRRVAATDPPPAP